MDVRAVSEVDAVVQSHGVVAGGRCIQKSKCNESGVWERENKLLKVAKGVDRFGLKDYFAWKFKTSMLIRISLIIAILAAIGAGVVNFVVVKDKIGALTDDRNTQRADKITAQTDLAKTQKDLARTQGDLKQTQSELADANAARKQAEDTAEAQTKRADDLTDKLTKAVQERDSAQNDLAAYKNTDYTPDQILKLAQSLKDTQKAIAVANDEKMVMSRTISRLSNQLAQLTGNEDYVVKLPAGLKGKVVVVDPKWDFVVLDIGDEQGVLQDGELLVSRDGKLVAKVVVRTVQKDRCIANIVPGWKLGDLFEGDDVSPAHPAT
jgi:multidrug efflux pump subunit AcrA (membrane-fusion protein)